MYTIIIREYRPNDAPYLGEVVRNAYLCNVTNSWINALTREVTFQLIVLTAAIMFIFVGVPLLYCLAAIPLIMIFIYVIIYSSFLMKATELTHSKKPLQCWVAEACEPFFLTSTPQNCSYKIFSEQKLWDNEVDVGSCQRKIVGTVSVMKHMRDEKTAWLFRLAVDKRYRCKGVGHALTQTVQAWCRSKRYESIQLVMSECQENARQVFVNTGFQMRQMYHKHLLGSGVSLLMFQLECDLKPNF